MFRGACLVSGAQGHGCVRVRGEERDCVLRLGKTRSNLDMSHWLILHNAFGGRVYFKGCSDDKCPRGGRWYESIETLESRKWP